jgi:large subunit ribosomal protein L25
LCEPSKIPEFLEIDVANLEVNESVHVSDLQVAKDVELHELPETVVASIVVVKEEELEPQLEAPDEPEIVGKDGKESEESES